MKKWILLSIFISAALIAVAFVSGTFFQKNRDEKQRAAQLSALREQNEKREELIDRPWINVVPGTTRDMLSADYWKTGSDDELLFTEEEIREYQYNNPLYVAYFDKPAGRTLKLRMYDLPDEIGGHAVNALIDEKYIDDCSDGTVTLYVNGQLKGIDYWDSIRSNCAFDLIPETVIPKYCVCVKRDLAMIIPTEDFASEDKDEIYCNDFISAEVMPLSGVVSLHESRDNKWCYIINGSYCGWVKKDCLAFCKDRDQWISAIRPDDFLTVTACDLTLDETALPTRTENIVLPMGTKVKLLYGYDGLVNGRKPYNCYVTEVPCRDQDGALDWEKVLIPLSEDVTVGNLSMTSDAVIDQAFKFLGKPYGYGGSFSSNDCSGMIRQIYACFGFELPRNSAAIAQLFDLGGRDFSGMASDKKLDIIKRMPTGTLLFMEGHLMIYLGTSDNKPYVISSCATFIEPGDNTGTLVGSYGVFVSNLEMLRKDGNTWLESMRLFQWKDY